MLRIVHRLLFLVAVFGLFAMYCGTSHAQRDFTRDNIVFVFVDDMGYADLNAKRMPKLTALTRRLGTNFDNFLVHQNCTPSRVAFLTGDDPSRVSMYANFPVPLRRGIPAQKELVSERLKTLGYSTCMVGKWGVGRAFAESAYENGFDDALQNARINNVPFSTKRFSDIYQADAAIKFLKLGEEPQFLYAAFESPHEQYKAPREYYEENRVEFNITRDEEAKFLVEKFGIVGKRPKEIPEELRLRINRCLYYSMLGVLDDQVARLYRTLEEEGKADHTLFMFVSDNGGIRPVADNGVYRSGKDFIYEGAHRACNAIIWPGVVRPGQNIKSNVWIGDMFSTFAHVAGEANPGLGKDGGTAIPAILRNGEIRRGQNNDDPALVAHVGKTRRPNDRHLLHGEFAVWRLGTKYIRFTDFTLAGQVQEVREEMYILSRDPGETRNLADAPAYVSLLEKMRKEYTKWGGNSRLLSLRIDDHAKEFPNFKPPKSWSRFRGRVDSNIWP